ncbi:hypothetical protein DIPPA_28730 [Diplonema papillatum]|nr:hypothetical protein DIPPA_28730 [Diplonema papillatum]
MEAVSASEEKWLANLSHAIRRRNALFVLPYEGIMTALAEMQATFPIAGNTKSQQAQKVERHHRTGSSETQKSYPA